VESVPLSEAILFLIGASLLPVLLTSLLRHMVQTAAGVPDPGRSPFTVDLARAPGYSLQQRIDEMQGDFAVNVTMACAMPLWFYAMWLTQERLDIAGRTGNEVLIYAIAAGAAAVLLGWRAVGLLLRLRRSRLSLHGKMAAGQEIDHLMRAGARIFHDLPGDGFHVDHVIVGRAGVFCVETETRAKPRHGRSVEDATAVYDGYSVRFPDLTDDTPVRHARERSRWLADWLARATGLTIPVQPVVALPRWVIDRQGRGEAIVINPRESSRLLARPMVLDDAQVEQVAFQLEKLGRGRREPTNYRATRSAAGRSAGPVGQRSRTQA
jgi:hypothetical protein